VIKISARIFFVTYRWYIGYVIDVKEFNFYISP